MKTIFRSQLMLAMLASALVVVTSSFTPKQDDSRISRTYDLKGFDRLSLGSAFEISVTKGNYSVKVEGRKQDIDDLEAGVSAGKLRIRYKDSLGWGRNRKRVTVTVSMPTLKGLDLSGATTSRVSGFNDLGTLDLDISGASKSDIQVKAQKIIMDASGASSITLTGNANRIEGEVSGATSIRAYDFPVKEAFLDVSGASNVRVSVNGKMEVEASGASSVRYRGTASVRSNTSGASSVKSES
ncbi:head GIN domain-containing protein [Runella limosa]|uniref:head GIN domain-containing protein n=1 Tax=Runella limosa TaxID=370978 RepID=UPI0006855079|nr:head GIN domain-containing protein [Runella limosa]